MAQRFVDDLVSAGHEVRLATFTSGGRTVLDVTENYEARGRRLARTPGEEDFAAERAAGRRDALERLSLYPSARRDPVPGTVTPIEGIVSVEVR